jgi:hypothetical protein
MTLRKVLSRRSNDVRNGDRGRGVRGRSCIDVGGRAKRVPRRETLLGVIVKLLLEFLTIAFEMPCTTAVATELVVLAIFALCI